MGSRQICSCDGSRHVADETCPTGLDRVALQAAIATAGFDSSTTMQVLTPQGAWVDVTAPLAPGIHHTIRYVRRSTT